MRPLAPKPDLVMQTHDAIRIAIMSGELEPFAPLAQEELAASLGVSRQPVSHALILLKREGLVVDRGRKGQMVAPIDAERLLALYQVRGALDGLAARLAATASKGINCQSILDKLIKDGASCVERGEIAPLVDADVAFHQAIYDLAGNTEISAMVEGCWPHMVRSMRVVLDDSDAHSGIWADHRAIANAIIAGDANAAETMATQHASKAGEATYQRLKSL